MVFAASAYGAGGGVVKLTKDADGAIKAEEVWFSKQMQNHHGGVILFDGCLYGANGGNEGGALRLPRFQDRQRPLEPAHRRPRRQRLDRLGRSAASTTAAKTAPCS